MNSVLLAVPRDGTHCSGHGPSPTLRTVSAAVPHALLDDVGKAIVEQLQQDGRRSYATIARAVGCPRPRCGSACSGCRRRA